jgi:hypothetical protein
LPAAEPILSSEVGVALADARRRRAEGRRVRFACGESR